MTEKIKLTSNNLQARVKPWLIACFGEEISNDKLERGDRHLEEVLELLQSSEYPKERIPALIEYVYNRPKGEPYQEVGGVMITLAAYCLAHDLDMHEAGEMELARIWTKVEKIREKQAAKPTGSALPMEVRTTPNNNGWILCADQLPKQGTQIAGVNEKGEVWHEEFDIDEPLGSMIFWKDVTPPIDIRDIKPA